ncbi:alpha/beta hydrolase [Aquibacillus sediminis]|uniref:alpha/beta hydrolase n=1 Tax=Aquibacillus sediminis TaxID=2574734 RepID=UPI00110932E1|nr:alpha/beta hydrolase-fold protein [Aquibacillus sediminis]
MQTVFYYQVKLPSRIKEDKKYPLLIAMHGIGYSEKHMMDVFDGVTDEYILVAPRGNLSYNKGFAYYYLEDYGKPDMDQFKESMKDLQRFIEDVLEEYPVDQDHVYLAGFSQGAILSNSLAFVLGERIRGIVSMNGYVPTFLKDTYQVQSVEHLNVFLIDGREDTIFPPKVGRENESIFRQAGATVSYQTYPTGHEIGEVNKQDAIQWLLDLNRNMQTKNG